MQICTHRELWNDQNSQEWTQQHCLVHPKTLQHAVDRKHLVPQFHRPWPCWFPTLSDVWTNDREIFLQLYMVCLWHMCQVNLTLSGHMHMQVFHLSNQHQPKKSNQKRDEGNHTTTWIHDSGGNQPTNKRWRKPPYITTTWRKLPSNR